MITFVEFESEIEKVKKYYPTLTNSEETKYGFNINGDLSIVDSNGWNWGTYKITIEVPEEYPTKLPLLRETGGKIERSNEWHISPQGICCVGTPAQQFRSMGANISLVNWIRLFVVPYLANHIYKKDRNQYVNGEFSHGSVGIFEDYSSCFSLSEPEDVIHRLRLLLGYDNLSLNDQCFCGSGKKYKRCYLIKKVDHFLHIPIEVIETDLRNLQRYYLRK